MHPLKPQTRLKLISIFAKRCRANMRMHAMTAREQMHPASFRMATFAEVTNRAAFYFRLAMEDRNRALGWEAKLKGGAS